MCAGFHRSGLLLSDDRTAVISFVPAGGDESVVISDSVTTIPPSLFSFRTSLKRIKLPASLRFIPDRLFEGCSFLEKIIMTPEIDSIGRAAFQSVRRYNRFRSAPVLRSFRKMLFHIVHLLQFLSYPILWSGAKATPLPTVRNLPHLCCLLLSKRSMPELLPGVPLFVIIHWRC